MAGPKQLVTAPTFVPREYGLLSVVETRYEVGDPHWRNGVIWESVCGLGGTTYDDDCEIPELADAPLKAENVTVYDLGATPFTVFAEVDCSPQGYTEAEQYERAMAALTRVESFQVEQSFWTGNVSASGVAEVYPHLAANTAVYEQGSGWLATVLLQTAATQVTGATLDVVEGVARLEGALARCANGQGVLHVTPEVADLMQSQYLLAPPRNGQLRTVLGNLVAVGAGYTGSSPAGTSATGVHWAYATSPVFAYRSEAVRLGTSYRENLDRQIDLVKTIAERTYLLGFDCCHLAVPISLGGVVSGSFNVAN